MPTKTKMKAIHNVKAMSPVLPLHHAATRSLLLRLFLIKAHPFDNLNMRVRGIYALARAETLAVAAFCLCFVRVTLNVVETDRMNECTYARAYTIGFGFGFGDRISTQQQPTFLVRTSLKIF